MKTHAIIPVFIPHAGCPHECVFCNQNEITAKAEPPSLEEADRIIRQHLETIRQNPSIHTVEVAFYGGSFTAIPPEKQLMYLKLAEKYKKRGEIDRIRLSTRPDYIDEIILERLASCGIDVVELGVQSFDEEVLRRSARGHDASVVFRSAELIRRYGIELGIQLMTGLPGDSYEKCMYSVEQTIHAAPSIARIYPTVVIRNTALFKMYQQGQYRPPALEETVKTVKDMYRRLTEAGIQVIRIGLKSTDLIRTENGSVVGGYHPAFRQLVESQIAREDLEAQLNGFVEGRVAFRSNSVSFSNMTGHQKMNRLYFEDKYPSLHIRYEQDNELPPLQYRVYRMPPLPAQSTVEKNDHLINTEIFYDTIES